jgi:hypothetical protein
MDSGRSRGSRSIAVHTARSASASPAKSFVCRRPSASACSRRSSRSRTTRFACSGALPPRPRTPRCAYRGGSDVQRTRSALTEILETSSVQFGAGTAVADAYRRMADSISEALPEAIFPHHGGHGIGITFGEDSQIIPDETSIAESGMVFALEPGAYFGGRYGVRVENTYVVNEDRVRLITEVETSADQA